jgi:hypothetical protein
VVIYPNLDRLTRARLRAGLRLDVASGAEENQRSRPVCDAGVSGVWMHA